MKIVVFLTHSFVLARRISNMECSCSVENSYIATVGDGVYSGAQMGRPTLHDTARTGMDPIRSNTAGPGN